VRRQHIWRKCGVECSSLYLSNHHCSRPMGSSDDDPTNALENDVHGYTTTNNFHATNELLPLQATPQDPRPSVSTAYKPNSFPSSCNFIHSAQKRDQRLPRSPEPLCTHGEKILFLLFWHLVLWHLSKSFCIGFAQLKVSEIQPCLAGKT